MTARALRWLHAGLALSALAFTPVAVFTDLKSSVPFLVAISMGALILSEFSSWQGARAEEAADDAETIAEAVYRRLAEDRVADRDRLG